MTATPKHRGSFIGGTRCADKPVLSCTAGKLYCAIMMLSIGMVRRADSRETASVLHRQHKQHRLHNRIGKRCHEKDQQSSRSIAQRTSEPYHRKVLWMFHRRLYWHRQRNSLERIDRHSHEKRESRRLVQLQHQEVIRRKDDGVTSAVIKR